MLVVALLLGNTSPVIVHAAAWRADAHNVPPGNGVPFGSGDVLVGGSTDGKVFHFAATGQLKDTLDTTTVNPYELGMCFDGAGNLYTTNWAFQGGNITKFDSSGNVIQADWVGTNYLEPESCVPDKAGNIYVGHQAGVGVIPLAKYDATGTLVATYTPDTEARGIDWIDLAADQCTLYYTSDGSRVKRFDVCRNQQLPDFATGLAGPCWALRILYSGQVLVACTAQAYLLGTDGSVVITYPSSNYGDSYFFALNLDPDGTSFWTAGVYTHMIYRIDIPTGNLISSFSASNEVSGVVSSLAVVGAQTPPVAPPFGTGGLPSPTKSTITVVNDQGFGGSLAILDGAASGVITVTLLDDGGKPVAGKSVELVDTPSGVLSLSLVRQGQMPGVTDASGIVQWIVSNARPGLAVQATVSAVDTTDNVKLHDTVTVIFKPIHPVILVHGINDSSDFWGPDDPSWNAGLNSGESGYFSVIWSQLSDTYSSGDVSAFVYGDDISYNKYAQGTPTPTTGGFTLPPCTLTPPDFCRSEDLHVNEYAISLAQQVFAQYDDSKHNPQQHKVSLVGFSLGGSIIRSMLAGCPDPITLQPQCSGVALLIDDVFFSNTAQQGSYWEDVAVGLDITTLLCGAAIHECRTAVAGFFGFVEKNIGPDLNSRAGLDSLPTGFTIVSRDLVPLPAGIHYFNFYGDINFHLARHLWTYTLPEDLTLPLGDLVIAAGNDDPQQVQPLGGARVCAGCTGTEQYESNGSTFSEWGFETDIKVDYAGLAQLVHKGDYSLAGWCNSGVAGDATTPNSLCTAPMSHFRVFLDHTQDPGATPESNAPLLLLRDTSGEPACKGLTTISMEIVCQIEKGDGI